ISSWSCFWLHLVLIFCGGWVSRKAPLRQGRNALVTQQGEQLRTANQLWCVWSRPLLLIRSRKAQCRGVVCSPRSVLSVGLVELLLQQRREAPETPQVEPAGWCSGIQLQPQEGKKVQLVSYWCLLFLDVGLEYPDGLCLLLQALPRHY
uniref:Uncharacterized protein n=1 Tax=Chelonoidis abingdonii TaxID=106734 RepID=A0A8C0IVR1_CHEAB